MSTEQIIIDTAVTADRDGIAHLLEQAYGRHNPYLVEVDDWLRGDGALTIVARTAPAGADDAPAGRAVVGLARLVPLTQDEWWIESLITHEGFRRRGITQRMFMFARAWWLTHGRGTVRGMVSNYNTAAQMLSEKWNASPTRIYIHYVASPDAAALAHGFTPLTEREVDAAVVLVSGAPVLAAAGGIVEQRWRWQQWSRDHAAKLARAGELFSWRGARGLAAMWARSGPDGPELRVWLAVSDDLVELARALRGYAAEVLPRLDPRPGRIHWRVPEAAGLDSTLRQAGFTIREGFEHRFLIYELVQLGAGGGPTRQEESPS